MLNEKKKILKSKINMFKIKYAFMILVNGHLQTVKFCIRHMVKICIPRNDKENKVMKTLLSTYDEAITELNRCVEIYRKRVDYKEN